MDCKGFSLQSPKKNLQPGDCFVQEGVPTTTRGVLACFANLLRLCKTFTCQVMFNTRFSGAVGEETHFSQSHALGLAWCAF